MTSKRWLGSFLLVVTILVLVTAAVNRCLNIYGLFGDVRGKSYSFYEHGEAAEREAKYLLSLNYIPANFDGLLLGTSVTDNWNTAVLQQARVYNLSIDGGNITEEAILVRNVIAKEKVRLVLFCVYPYLVESHGRRTGYMSPRDYWGALGSVQLLREYKAHVLGSLKRAERAGDEFGVADFSNQERTADANAAERRFSEGKKVLIDEDALRQYGSLVDEVRAKGVRIVAFLPPHPYGVWNTREYDDFVQKSGNLFHAGEIVIDFNTPEYDTFRRNKANFYDGVHLSQQAASFMISEINRQIGDSGFAMVSGKSHHD